jgi:fructokinase
LFQAEPASRAETRKLLDALPGVMRFYDVNLRRDSYSPALVLELMSTAQVVKLNEDEAAEIDAQSACRNATLAEFTDSWSRKMGGRAVAVTRGAQGCAVRIGEDYAEVAGNAVKVVDTVGAGDAFAAAFLHGLWQGWGAERTGDLANRVGAVVAASRGVGLANGPHHRGRLRSGPFWEIDGRSRRLSETGR